MSGAEDERGELPASAEAEWGRFARHLAWMGEEAGARWLVFVFAYSPAVANLVRERVKGYFEGGGEGGGIGSRKSEFVQLPAETPNRLQNVLPRLLGDETERAGCVWIQTVNGSGEGEEQAGWRAAWEQLLLGMNERRDAIRRHVAGGLVLVGPLWMKELAQAAAPDLWSVRTLVLELPEDISLRKEDAPGAEMSTEESCFVVDIDGRSASEQMRRSTVVEIERVVRLRERDASVEERPAPPPFDVLFVSTRKSGRIVDVGAVAVFDAWGVAGELSPGILEAFLREVQAPLLRESPLLRSTLVHGDYGVPVPDALVEEAARHRVHLLPLSEYENVVDFSRYLRWQSARLDRDEVYPPAHYVEQRAEVRVGVDRLTTEDALSEVHRQLLENDARFVLVLGDFGTGKTFLLRQLARRMTADPRSPAPVLIEMRDLQKSLSLDMLLAQHFVRVPDGQIAVDAFRFMLSQGRAALLFDGFDELAFRLSYDNVREHLQTILQAATGKARVVLTSRTAHFLNDRDVELALERDAKRVTGYTLFKLAPFDTGRIHRALVKRLGGEEPVIEREALLAKVDLTGLSSNPRMLAFILDSFTPEELREVGESHAKLTRSGVYERLVTRWLHGEMMRATPRGAESPMSEVQLWRAVTDFALLLWPCQEMSLQMKDVPEQLWLGLQALDPVRTPEAEELKVSVGSRSLLVRDEEGRFSFLHHSILEWLVARDAAQELAEHGTAVMLKRRVMSPLMADFLLEMGGPEAVGAWARAALSRGEEAAKNGALLLQKIGPGGAERPGIVEQRLDLSGKDLSGQDFSGTEYLKGANLSNAKLDRATLVRADLTGASLVGASLRGVDARGASFRDCDLTLADLTRADLRKGDISEAKLDRARLVGARLLGAKVSGDAFQTSTSMARPHEERATAISGGFGTFWIHKVSFSADGKTLLAFQPATRAHGRGVEQLVTLWNLPLCVHEGTTDLSREGGQHVTGAAPSNRLRDDISIAGGGAFLTSMESWGLEIRGVDPQDRRPLRRAFAGVRAAAGHPSSPILAVCADDHLLHIWDATDILLRSDKPPLLATLVAGRNGWAAFAPDARYKAMGDVHDMFWHQVNGCRFEAGELDDDLDAFDIPPRRVPMDEPLFEMPGEL